MSVPNKRQEVVLADRMERNVSEQHDLVVFLMKNRLEVNERITSQPSSQLGVRTSDTIWSSAQTFPVRVFTDRDHDFTNSPLDAVYIYCRRSFTVVEPM